MICDRSMENSAYIDIDGVRKAVVQGQLLLLGDCCVIALCWSSVNGSGPGSTGLCVGIGVGICDGRMCNVDGFCVMLPSVEVTGVSEVWTAVIDSSHLLI